MQRINFYRQRVAINVLAKDIANAREIHEAAEGHAVIGVLSAQFTSVEQGVAEVRRWMADSIFVRLFCVCRAVSF